MKWSIDVCTEVEMYEYLSVALEGGKLSVIAVNKIGGVRK